MPKLLFVTRSTVLHPGSGGMEKVFWQLARQLAGRFAVAVLTTPIPGRPTTSTVDGISVHTVERGRPGRYGPAWWLQTALHPAARGADLVFSVSAGATAMLWRRGPAFLFQAHGTALAELAATLGGRPPLWPLKALRSAVWSLIDSVSYRRVDAVVAVSDTVCADLERAFYRRAWRGTRLAVVPNGIAATSVRRGPGLVPRPPHAVAITVSRLVRQKGVDRAIAALAHTAEEVGLLVVGDGEDAGTLREQAATLGVGHRVRFTGEVDGDGIADALGEADVFLFPARHAQREGLPLAVLEALAAGLPVLVPTESRWPADLEALMERVDMDDPAALAAAVVRVSGSVGSKGALPARYRQEAMLDAYRSIIGELVDPETCHGVPDRRETSTAFRTRP